MERLLSVLPPQLGSQIKANCDIIKSEGSSSVQFYSQKCQYTLSKVESLINYLKGMQDNDCPTEKNLHDEIDQAEILSILVRGIDKTLEDNTKLLLNSKSKGKSKKSNPGQKILICENRCAELLDTIKEVVNRIIPIHYQYACQSARLTGKQLINSVHSGCPTRTSDKDTQSVELNSMLNKLQSDLSRDDPSSINLCCLSLFPHLGHFTEPKKELLKRLTAQEIKDFGKWITLFDQAFARYAQVHADTVSPIHLQSITRVLTIFANTTFDFDNLKALIKFLQSLDKPYFQKYHPQFTGVLIRIFTRQLKNLIAIIEEKSKKNDLFKLEQGFKSKLIDAINKLLPGWQLLNDEQHLELLSSLMTKDDESYWFDLIYAFAHHYSNHSHPLSSTLWQQNILTKLESYDSNAQQMLTAICNQDPAAVLQVETSNHRLLWLKAFLYNQAGDHQRAHDAIILAEQRCDELGITTEPRLQLEIARIKLDSLKVLPGNDELSDELRHIIKQLDRLGGIRAGCTRFNPAGHQQLWACTGQECTLVELLKTEAQALKKVSDRTSSQQVQLTQENDESPIQESTTPVMLPLEIRPPTQDPEAICQKILGHLQLKHHRNQAEALTPDETFMVMAGNGKPLSVTDAMKQDNWNGKIYRLLHEVKTNRNDGDFINELLTYQEILTSDTGKQALGIHRLLLELSWTLMRHADHAQEKNTLTRAQSTILLDYAWEFMVLSVCRAMRRNSAFPEHLSDEQLITTVIEWIQALQEPELKSEMEFFMRCALGSTAGHINGFRAELFPAKREHLEQRAIYFFNAKHRLQPSYVKPQHNEDRQMRSTYMNQPQPVRW